MLGPFRPRFNQLRCASCEICFERGPYIEPLHLKRARQSRAREGADRHPSPEVTGRMRDEQPRRGTGIVLPGTW